MRGERNTPFYYFYLCFIIYIFLVVLFCLIFGTCSPRRSRLLEPPRLMLPSGSSISSFASSSQLLAIAGVNLYVLLHSLHPPLLPILSSFDSLPFRRHIVQQVGAHAIRFLCELEGHPIRILSISSPPLSAHQSPRRTASLVSSVKCHIPCALLCDLFLSLPSPLLSLILSQCINVFSQNVFYVFGVIGALCTTAMVLFLPETRPKAPTTHI